MNLREIKGKAIIGRGCAPTKIDADCYLIPSQSSDKKYKVRNAGFEWNCECPDYLHRNLECKHIHAIKFWLNLKSKKENIERNFALEISKSENNCVYCNSKNIIKRGIRKTQRGEKQRFLCKACGKKFVQDQFKKFRGDGKAITLVIDLYFKGVSLRKIQDHLQQFYNIEVSHVCIYKWIRKFMCVMNNYVETLQPQASKIWHADEQMIKKNGKHFWIWNVLDKETRFLLANNLTKGRDISEAREVFAKAKALGSPAKIITDGLWSYEKAIKKEFHTFKGREGRTQHIRLESFKKKPNNNLIERFHGSFRERDKVMRGFKNGAENFANNYKTFYNFIRIHQALGTTPSEMAGINLNLGSNRWLGLLNQSMQAPMVNNQENSIRKTR